MRLKELSAAVPRNAESEEKVGGDGRPKTALPRVQLPETKSGCPTFLCLGMLQPLIHEN